MLSFVTAPYAVRVHSAADALAKVAVMRRYNAAHNQNGNNAFTDVCLVRAAPLRRAPALRALRTRRRLQLVSTLSAPFFPPARWASPPSAACCGTGGLAGRCISAFVWWRALFAPTASLSSLPPQLCCPCCLLLARCVRSACTAHTVAMTRCFFFFRRLRAPRAGEIVCTTPTVGANMEELTFQNVHFEVRNPPFSTRATHPNTPCATG